MVSRVARLHIQILSVAFAAGAVGGLVNFLIAPLFGALHITTALGVNIAPGLSKVGNVRLHVLERASSACG